MEWSGVVLSEAKKKKKKATKYERTIESIEVASDKQDLLKPKKQKNREREKRNKVPFPKPPNFCLFLGWHCRYLSIPALSDIMPRSVPLAWKASLGLAFLLRPALVILGVEALPLPTLPCRAP